MPLYVEYDKTNGMVQRVITADTLPINVAYLAYQELPDGLEVDLSLPIKEITDAIMQWKNQQNKKQQVPTPSTKEEKPVIIEV